MTTGRSRLTDAVYARIEELRRHAVGCVSCTTCESMAVFGALIEVVDDHARNHTCDAGSPRLTYGTGLPHGPDCPRLCGIASQLGVTAG